MPQPVPASTPHRVVVLLVDEVVGYDATIPPQVLGQARVDGAPAYDVRLATVDGEPARASMGYGLVPHGGPELLATAETVIVPGTHDPASRRDGTVDPALAEAWALVPASARLVSICTGAFVLAAAGVLDGRRATTHWAYADDLRRLHPEVEVDESVLYTEDDDVLTSAGLAAGVDLCLHLVRVDHGAQVASAVARHMVVPPWREGGQAQFIGAQVDEHPTDSTAPARAWALERIDEPLQVPELADVAGMSVRTFARRFRAETGLAPGTWLIQQRVRHAQRLLETSDLGVDEIAERSGLGSAGSLRAHLRSVAGVTPSAYRKTFRGA